MEKEGMYPISDLDQTSLTPRSRRGRWKVVKGISGVR